MNDPSKIRVPPSSTPSQVPSKALFPTPPAQGPTPISHQTNDQGTEDYH